MTEESGSFLSEAEVLRQIHATDGLGGWQDQTQGEAPGPQRQMTVLHQSADATRKKNPFRAHGTCRHLVSADA